MTSFCIFGMSGGTVSVFSVALWLRDAAELLFFPAVIAAFFKGSAPADGWLHLVAVKDFTNCN